MAVLTSLVPGSTVRVRVPASSANIGPGFDSIGLALGIWDEYVVTVVAEPGLHIDVKGEGVEDLPRDELNLVHQSMTRAWQELAVQVPTGLHMSCHNAVPHCRGLGSSATSIVAGIVVAQGLCDIASGQSAVSRSGGREVGRFDGNFDRIFTNNLAAALEGHPDNSSASIFGGMTLSWTDDVDPEQIHTVQLEVSSDVIPLVFVPDARLSTETARAVLPAQVPHAVAARNAGRAGLLVEAVTRRPDVLLAATREWLHQEQRRTSFPESMAFLDVLRGKGHAAVISGAGPSVLVLTTAPQLEDARAQGDPSVWRVLQPGIPATGASLERLPDRSPLAGSL
ncbi:MAG: homoserine kinase [Actinomycetota bacterium]|nr:homoserine kinase [Actinomycetota bacterium]